MGKKHLDAIVVIDIEATCWRFKKETPPNQESEIIEIGVCVLDIDSGKRTEKESILVKPERSIVSPFCTKLTTLTQAQVDKGISFAKACDRLRMAYHSRNRTWASYGHYDLAMFEKQCANFGVDYPFGTEHLNVKHLFALKNRLSKEVGMAAALDMMNIPLEGTHHRGGDDAWNIALLLSKLLWSN